MLPLLLLPALAGCAAGPDRRAVLDALVGQPEAQVVRQLGVPTRSYDAGGHRFLAYAEQHTDVVPVGGFFGGGFGGGWGGWGGGYGFYGLGPQVFERVCETTFEVGEGRVLSWTLRGNACG